MGCASIGDLLAQHYALLVYPSVLTHSCWIAELVVNLGLKWCGGQCSGWWGRLRGRWRGRGWLYKWDWHHWQWFNKRGGNRSGLHTTRERQQTTLLS